MPSKKSIGKLEESASARGKLNPTKDLDIWNPSFVCTYLCLLVLVPFENASVAFFLKKFDSCALPKI